jgi:hypothetical protein
MEVTGQPHAPATLPQGKNPSYPLNRELSGPQSHSGILVKILISCPWQELKLGWSSPWHSYYTDHAISTLLRN